MIEILNDEFVNTWIIIPQFENPEEFFEDMTARKWAETIAKEFTYPVDSIVLSSEGKPRAQGSYKEVRSSAEAYLKKIRPLSEEERKSGR